MCSHRDQIVRNGRIICKTCGHDFGPQAIDRLREVAAMIGGLESSDGLFLLGVADAIQHGDAMDELGGKTLSVVACRK